MNSNTVITAVLVVVVLAVVAVQVAAFTGGVPRWLEITAQIGGAAVICAYMVYMSITKTGGRRR